MVTGISYAIVTPPFEAPDEASHLQVIHYLAQERRLYTPVTPVLHVLTGPDAATFLRPHTPPRYYTPPLYHIAAAIVTSGIDMHDLADRLIPSPSWEMGWSPQRNTDPWNKNFYVHLPGETLAGSPTVRATTLLRLFSLGISLVTILCTYHIARAIHPDRPAFALGAAAFVALNPQFISLSASVTNDPLLIAIFSLTLYLALRFMRTGVNWTHWAALGGLVGTGMLTKQSALLLLPLVSATILEQQPVGTRLSWSKILIDGSAFGLTALMVGGGWYLANAIKYDDPLGMQVHFETAIPLHSFGLRQAQALFETYWAGFGHALISAPAWVYQIIGGIVIVASLGGLRSVLPKGAAYRIPTAQRRSLAILALTLAINAVSVVRWAIATGAPYGRLLFPSIAAAGVLLAWGWDQWRHAPGFRTFSAILAGLAVILASLIPWYVIKPVYTSPVFARVLPQKASTVIVTFDNGIALLGYRMPHRDLYPGDTIDISLYWRAISAPSQRYTTWIQISPQDPTQRIAEENRWLGGTLYPSDLWQTGDTIRQTHTLQLPDSAPAPGLYWIRLGLVDASGARITFAGDDNTISLGPWRIRRKTAVPEPTVQTRYLLDNGIVLKGYDIALGHAPVVTLTWSTTAAIPDDYRVFVHLVDENGTLIAQHDGPAANGHYPTSWWLRGDTIRDPHRLPLPASLTTDNLALRVGMYNPGTLSRLPAYDADGARLPNDAIPLPLAPAP